MWIWKSESDLNVKTQIDIGIIAHTYLTFLLKNIHVDFPIWILFNLLLGLFKELSVVYCWFTFIWPISNYVNSVCAC